MSSFPLMQLAMNSARISPNKTNRASVRVLKAIKMPRITERQANVHLLARAVKCLATMPDYNKDLVDGIESVLAENIIPVKRAHLRNLLTYVKLLPHIWEGNSFRSWTLLKSMYEDDRISCEELDMLTMTYAASIDVDHEMERAMEEAEQGKVNEDELLTVADELKAVAEWKKVADFHGKRGEEIMNTSAK